ncbi:DUF2195 family protein [Agaribacterium haliotis]|uniref:DUF2195 family protein n=1 Tax=Agaribacterium haliotis TaxID=2013869 RepID=UPI000BB54022|nr:DUF2195 family protein [Agaribacterium haliotis]
MVVPKSSILWFLFTSGCAFGGQDYEIFVDNYLEQCVNFDLQAVEINESGVYVPVVAKTIRSTAACGCRSMVNQYRVSMEHAHGSSALMQGLFIIRENSAMKLPLTMSERLIGDGATITVVFSCGSSA